MPKKIPYDLINLFFKYDPNTGVVSWKERQPLWFEDGKYDSLRKANIWNARCAGKSAGCNNGAGYLSTRLMGVNYKVHRLAMCLILKDDFDGIVDHINGSRSDNRACNLRVSTASRNSQNTHAHREGSAGVVWYKPLNKWRAQIWANGKNINLGYFDSKDDARLARLDGEVKYWEKS